MKLLLLKKLAFKSSTYIFKYQPLPPFVPLESTHMMNTPRPSSIFTGLPFPCIILLEGYNREGLGTKINHSHIHPFQLNATTFVDLMSCTRLYQMQGTGNNASSFVVRFNPGLDYRRLVQTTNFPTKPDSHSERVGLHEIGLLGLDQSTSECRLVVA